VLMPRTGRYLETGTVGGKRNRSWRKSARVARRQPELASMFALGRSRPYAAEGLCRSAIRDDQETDGEDKAPGEGEVAELRIIGEPS
jgi:hypothetical protein